MRIKANATKEEAEIIEVAKCHKHGSNEAVLQESRKWIEERVYSIGPMVLVVSMPNTEFSWFAIIAALVLILLGFILSIGKDKPKSVKS